MDSVDTYATEIDMFSDASRNFCLGFGAYCQREWTFRQWCLEFMKSAEPSIEYLELYAVMIAVKLWLKKFKNKRIILFCDNEAVVHMINDTSSKCKNCMVLLRILVLENKLELIP